MNKALVSALITLFCAAIMASAKSFVDVEKLKTETMSMYDLLKETRQDVRDIKKFLLESK